MAVTASGLFGATLTDLLDTTQLAIDLDLETHKYALFSNTITPDFDATAANAAYGAGVFASNEVSGTGWSAGGIALTGTTVAFASGVLTFDATDISQSGTTLTNARCGLLYADALAGDNAILLQDFASDYSTVNGIFAVTMNGSGIFTIDYTP